MTTNNAPQADAVNDTQADRICTADILQVAKLSHLAVDEAAAENFATDIDKILNMMQTLSSVDTEGLMPLANVHEAAQKLRADVPNANIDRESNQSVAPAVQQGLYLVPQVIE
ncbi:Asp-tRNA(Asn)/Glu-tRNA(Gln) amidotransferase subunit GatC [Psychrobacter sp. FDAARGOS_221]|uniref:Asp-tRNA(Asn)/Glu-tRNA(Gln) amidotransferase subunit GatC n=1 Tax=Psychrobacter sp. FDAARGOS_221 TaxID=1975705 RepID=UPI000BB55C32|nr:Asp-tRNA(Asn)/Glu-tRNA(Gln) amidotransferase subunit GatC [Psychrobacter sp. FDAARGOS_221]PNK60337.1 Asp-tRNA(Asn)/Glu-tRNA(Gln) amidotransferase subunit GatC [Psychrobacter sp. FDAARGOS_221]